MSIMLNPKEEDCIFATRDEPEPALDMIGAGVDKPLNPIQAPLSVTEISQLNLTRKMISDTVEWDQISVLPRLSTTDRI
jgi:hypothetical protein